jgi:hypothetical protein
MPSAPCSSSFASQAVHHQACGVKGNEATTSIRFIGVSSRSLLLSNVPAALASSLEASTRLLISQSEEDDDGI